MNFADFQGKISKFRVRFLKSPGKSNVENCLEVAEILKKYTLVSEHSSHNSKFVQCLSKSLHYQCFKFIT